MRFESPTTTKAAASILAGESGAAHVLAGGTDLLVRMKMGMIEPDLVLDIKRIESMKVLKVAAVGSTLAVPCLPLNWANQSGYEDFGRVSLRRPT